jgi:hypothetical protein
MRPSVKSCSLKNHQRGAVLVVLILLMVLAFSTALLTGISSTHTKLARSAQSLSNLSEAKTAVIAYAQLSDPDKSPTGLQHRYLPCPDTDGDGQEETPCGTTSAEGWLPWQTLGLPPLRDASGSCFRYYISSEYKQGTAVPPLKSALPPAEFTLSDPDQLISNNVVAIIFAPNTVVAGQIRGAGPGSPTECGSTSTGAPINQSQNLLDSIAGTNNANSPDFIVAPQGDTFNDVAIWITSTELL